MSSPTPSNRDWIGASSPLITSVIASPVAWPTGTPIVAILAVGAVRTGMAGIGSICAAISFAGAGAADTGAVTSATTWLTATVTAGTVTGTVAAPSARFPVMTRCGSTGTLRSARVRAADGLGVRAGAAPRRPWAAAGAAAVAAAAVAAAWRGTRAVRAGRADGAGSDSGADDSAVAVPSAVSAAARPSA